MRNLLLLSAFGIVACVCVAEGVSAPQREGRATFVCHARNLLGKRFSATGTEEAATQEAAMQKCEQSAFRCYPTGCETTEGR